MCQFDMQSFNLKRLSGLFEMLDQELFNNVNVYSGRRYRKIQAAACAIMTLHSKSHFSNEATRLL